MLEVSAFNICRVIREKVKRDFFAREIRGWVVRCSTLIIEFLLSISMFGLIILQIIETLQGEEDSLISFACGEGWNQSEKRELKMFVSQNNFGGIRLFQSYGRIKWTLHCYIYFKKMEISQDLYSSHAPSPIGKLLFSCQASRRDQGDVTASIYQHCLVESSSKSKVYLPFDFDVKFAFELSPPSVTFEKNEKKGVYILRSAHDLQQWRDILKAKLNQRGFHEQFKPKKKIGKGNFASVYLAEKLEDGKSYAVKAFSKEAAYSEDKGKECLIKEIEVMRNLNHKNCMKLYEVFQSQNSLYIVVELLEGGQLYDKVKAKYKFRPMEVKTAIFTILQGLKEMHSKKIMHRDLKPENILFRAQGSFECAIADFGLAEFSDAQEYLFVRCGTPGYVAPEVINIKDMKTKYEPICDIFSLGLIFHILLLGVSAFPGKTYNEVLAQNRASNILLQGEEYKSMDPKALNLLGKMLKKNPQDRITAVEALNHPYFAQGLGDLQEESDTVHELSRKPSYPNCDSPLLTSSNPARKQQEKLTKKDSCVEFKMGKENVFTGKVDTIAETGSTGNSVGKKFQSVVMPKISKFSTKK